MSLGNTSAKTRFLAPRAGSKGTAILLISSVYFMVSFARDGCCLVVSGCQSLFTFPEVDRIKDDPAIWTALESKPGPVFVFLVDDGDLFVLVGLAVPVDADSDRSKLVLNDQIDPLAKFHL